MHVEMTGIHRSHHVRLSSGEVLLASLRQFRRTGPALEQTSERKKLIGG
jgi:hypothetical protein